jgi:putative phosphoribosyl transferase
MPNKAYPAPEEESMPIIEKQWTTTVEQPVSIEAAGVQLKGDLIVPEETFGLVVFAAGGEMNRTSSRSRRIAREFEEQGLAVLLVDLLTAKEEEEDLRTSGRLRTDISLLVGRMLGVVKWVDRQSELRDLPVGIFGQGSTAPAALVLAAERPRNLGAIVCRSGRVDLAGSALADVQVPVLLLVGGADEKMVEVNESALLRLTGTRRRELVLIPGTPSRLDDPTEIEAVADLSTDWFSQALIELC